MKLLGIVVALAACQSKSQPPAQGSAAPPPPPVTGSAAAPAPVAHTAEICRDTLATLDRATCGSNNEAGLRAARTSVEGIINTMTKIGDADATSYDIMCARLLLALDQDLGSDGCTIPMDASLRDRVTRTLDAFYNQRTPVTKTGDAASDEVIAKIAAMRDAACECRTGACLDKLDADVAKLPTLPATAPTAARELGSKLLDDATRCAQRARLNTR